MDYFECETHLQSADDFYILIISIFTWLYDLELPDAHPDGLAETLFNVSKAVNTMVDGLGTSGFEDVIYPPLPPQQILYNRDIHSEDLRHPFYVYGDNMWRILLRRKVSLPEFECDTNYFPAFGPLLHVIAEGFVKKVFFVAEEWPEYLHSALREVHEYGGCGDDSCRWASHDYGDHDDADCPLLVRTPLEVEEGSSNSSLSSSLSSVDHTHTSPRCSTSISQLDEDGAYSVSSSNSANVQAD